MTRKYKMPTVCPVCSGALFPSEVTCDECASRIQSAFEPSRFCRLSADQLQFVEIFLRSRGNLSGVGDELDISYPTVTRRLDAVLAALGSPGGADSGPLTPPPAPTGRGPSGKTEEERAIERREILALLDRGDITADQATRRLQDL